MDRMDRTPNLHVLGQNNANGVTPFDYKELAREVLSRIDQRLADLADVERDTPPRRAEARYEEEDADDDRDSDEGQDSETSGDAMSPDDQAAITRLALRGLTGLVLSAVVVAGVAWLWSHHGAAKQVAAQWSSRLVMNSAASEERPQAGAAESPPPATKVVAETAPTPVAVTKIVAETAPAPVVPAQAAPPPAAPRAAADTDKPAAPAVPSELMELMRKVDRDIAGLAQAVTDLKAAQQQVSDNDAKTAADIKASLEQIARTIVAEARVEQSELSQAKQSAAAPAPPARAVVPKGRKVGGPTMYPRDPRDAEAEYLRRARDE